MPKHNTLQPKNLKHQNIKHFSTGIILVRSSQNSLLVQIYDVLRGCSDVDKHCVVNLNVSRAAHHCSVTIIPV